MQVSKGDLLLALSYDASHSILKGLVLKATNLKKQDVIGLAGESSCDLYSYIGVVSLVWGLSSVHCFLVTHNSLKNASKVFLEAKNPPKIAVIESQNTNVL